MTRKTFIKIATAGLLGFVGLLPGCHATYQAKYASPKNTVSNSNLEISVDNFNDCLNDLKFQDVPEGFVRRNDKKAEPSSGAYYTGYASASYATNFLTEGGIVLGRGPVVQSQVNVERNDNLVKGDKILVGAFGNYDIKDGNLVEADFTAKVTRPVYFMENLMGGYDKPEYGDFVFLGYQHRQYPNGLLGTRENYDHVLFASWLHSSRADLKFDWLHLFSDMDTNSGDLFRFTASKKVKIGEILDGSLYMGPFISTSYACNNWYGLNGFTDVISGVNVSLEKNNSVIAGKIQCQSSLNPDVKDVLYAGVELGWKF